MWKMQELLSRFSCVQLYATPETAAHQAPLSLGFSRQEHWSGLPYPPPMHESEKWKWSCSVVFVRPHGLQPTRLLHPWQEEHFHFLCPFSRQEYWSGLPSPSPRCKREMCKRPFPQFRLGQLRTRWNILWDTANRERHLPRECVTLILFINNLGKTSVSVKHGVGYMCLQIRKKLMLEM